jgi:hypothetical protein
VNASLPSSPRRRGTDPSLFFRLIDNARVSLIRRAPTLLLVLVVVEPLACTLLVDTKVRQCQTSADCTRFGDSVCDADQLICVPRVPAALPDAAVAGPDAAAFEAAPPGPDVPIAAPDAPIAASDAPVASPDVAAVSDGAPAGCRGVNGCYSCPPQRDLEYLNACTDQRCIPFDNGARLKNLAPDGTLKPLP